MPRSRRTRRTPCRRRRSAARRGAPRQGRGPGTRCRTAGPAPGPARAAGRRTVPLATCTEGRPGHPELIGRELAPDVARFLQVLLGDVLGGLLVEVDAR